MSKKQTILKRLASWGLFENVVKFVQNIEKQQNIKIKNFNQIIIGVDEKSISHVKELLQDNFGIVREDLFLPEAESCNPPSADKINLETFKGFIEDKHYQALLASATIVRLEDGGHLKKASEMKKHLINTHGEEGRRIYNLYRSNFIEKWFYWDLITMRIQGKEDIVKERYKQEFKNVLKYSKNAIWVNEETLFEDIINRVWERFHGKGVKIVYIHAKRPENIEKIREACNYFLDSDNWEYECQENEYEIAEQPSLRIKISRKTEIEYKKGSWQRKKMRKNI